MSEGTVDQVLAGSARWTVVQGDTLLLVPVLPSDCCDLLATDCPYSSGGQFRGDRNRSTREKYTKGKHEESIPDDFAGDTRDQRSYQLWTSFWCAEALRVIKPGGVACLFTDWRQLPATVDAFQAGGWVLRGIVPWDKTNASRPRAGGFRSQCEFIVWGSKGPLLEQAVYLEGCFRDGCLRVPVGKNKLHQAVKPDELMDELVRLCPPDGIVLDLFVGSGSTGQAARRAGRRFVGFEILPSWVTTARERIRAEAEYSTLRAREAGQSALPFTQGEGVPAGARAQQGGTP